MMRIVTVSTLFLVLCLSSFCQANFKETQRTYARVENAYLEKEAKMKDLLTDHQLEIDEIELCIRIYKAEKEFEIWVREKGEEIFSDLKTYDICTTSGGLGPKRMQGDLQIPEGFYHLNVFNPWSSFHLSLGINYPNRSDRILGTPGRLGGDIYIHGACVTIGCIPLTDDVIKEVYLLCVEARNNGQEKIPVTIFPARMTTANYDSLTDIYMDDTDRLSIWHDLKIAYNAFERNKRLPEVTFLNDGRHQFSQLD